MVSENRYDGEILFHIDNVIKSTQKDLFLVIHTYGSHTSHIKRYPREFSHFTPDEARSVSRKNRDRIRNAYDNTIRYTDHVLSEIIRLLEATGECTAMVYCSDHGEDVLDDRRDRFLHASPTTTYYQLHIPAFAWFSGKYSNAFTAKEKAAVNNKDNPATTASVFHTIADIASISSPYLNVSYSLVSEDYKPYPRMYINDYDIALNIVNSGLDKEDFEMFDRKGITYDKTEIHKELF